MCMVVMRENAAHTTPALSKITTRSGTHKPVAVQDGGLLHLKLYDVRVQRQLGRKSPVWKVTN